MVGIRLLRVSEMRGFGDKMMLSEVVDDEQFK